jgi:hypothetical protein
VTLVLETEWLLTRLHSIAVVGQNRIVVFGVDYWCGYYRFRACARMDYRGYCGAHQAYYVSNHIVYNFGGNCLPTPLCSASRPLCFLLTVWVTSSALKCGKSNSNQGMHPLVIRDEPNSSEQISYLGTGFHGQLLPSATSSAPLSFSSSASDFYVRTGNAIWSLGRTRIAHTSRKSLMMERKLCERSTR